MPIVIHHNDNDGFMAAFVASLGLAKHPDVFPEFVETNYGQEPPGVAGRDVYILDFSYPRATLETMHAVANKLIVIDHHKTAEAELIDLPYCIFDMNKSGCKLAQEFFGVPDHWMVDYIQDRDLWKFVLPHSKEINAAISSYPKTFEEWQRLWGTDRDELLTEGIAIVRYQDKLVQQVCLQAEEVEIAGHKVPLVNAPVLQSEIGTKLCEGKPFAATFSVRPSTGKKVYSLRSDSNGLDVSEIAKGLGGGGHKHAAGFSIE